MEWEERNTWSLKTSQATMIGWNIKSILENNNLIEIVQDE